MEKVTVNLLSVAGKARSKAALYRILTIDGCLYLPPYKYCTVAFMADIIEGSKIVYKGKSHMMLNKSKKKSREEIRLKLEEEKKEHQSHISCLQHEVMSLKDELLAANYDKTEADKNADLLNTLYKRNVIDKDGNITTSSS